MSWVSRRLRPRLVHVRERSQQGRLFGDVSWSRFGLLDGLEEDISTAKFYSRSMDLRRAADMISHRDFISKAGLRDAGGDDIKLKENLGRILGNTHAFFDQKWVWNQEELQGALGDIMQHRGDFVCILGGKSTGKSLLLRDLVHRSRSKHGKVPKVFLVNIREHGTTSAGVLRVLTDLGAKRIFRMLPQFGGLVKGLAPLLSYFMQGIGHKIPGLAEAHAAAISRTPLADRSKDAHFLRILLHAMIKEFGPVTVVIDDANLAFNLEPADTESGVHPTREVLELFTTFTKEQQQANVILVSSDYSFPFGLRKVMFDLANFTGFMYAGEVSPKDMLRVLEEKWGVGPQLALALLGHYGGHVWDAYQALKQLCGHPAFFVGVDPLKSLSVRKCLAWKPSVEQQELESAERGRMRGVLRLLAKEGFAPILMEEDPVVKAGSLVVGLSPEVWGEADLGLVPTTQSMRLAIAVELMSQEEKQEDTTEVRAPEP